MKKILLMLVLVSVQVSRTGDCMLRQNQQFRPQEVILGLAVHAAVGGHPIAVDGRKFQSQKHENKQRKQQQIAVICQRQQFPKKRLKGIGQSKRGK